MLIFQKLPELKRQTVFLHIPKNAGSSMNLEYHGTTIGFGHERALWIGLRLLFNGQFPWRYDLVAVRRPLISRFKSCLLYTAGLEEDEIGYLCKVTSLLVRKQSIRFYQHWRSPHYYAIGKLLFRSFVIIDIDDLKIRKVNVNKKKTGDIMDSCMVQDWVEKHWKQL